MKPLAVVLLRYWRDFAPAGACPNFRGLSSRGQYSLKEHMVS